jgi:hypothetical protein
MVAGLSNKRLQSILQTKHQPMTKNKLRELLKSNTAGLIYFLIIVAGGWLYGDIKSQNFVKAILEKPEITIGFINNTHFEKNGFVVEYSFNAGEKDLSSYVSHPRFISIRSLLYNGRSFPVIFSSTNPEKNEMLILPEDFNHFNVPFPDSLSWELEYLDKF